MLRSLSLIAALVLCPITASAQAPAPAKTAPRNVSIQVAFVAVKIADLDACGINFDYMPLSASSETQSSPVPPEAFLMLAAGSDATQVYQTLTRKIYHAVLAAPVTTQEGSPVTIGVDAEVSMPEGPTANRNSKFPQLTGAFRVHGKITLTPYAYGRDAVKVDMLSPLDSKPIRLRTVPSGQQILFIANPVKPVHSNGMIQYPIEALNAPQLLIFITPTILPQIITIPTPEQTVTLTVINGSLRDTIEKLELQYGIKCLVQDSTVAYGPLNISLSEIPLSMALSIIASSVGAQVTRNADGVYVFTPKNIPFPFAPLSPMPQTPFWESDGGFGSTGFGPNRFPQYSVVFPHTLPIGASDFMRGSDEKKAANPVLPDAPKRFYALD